MRKPAYLLFLLLTAMPFSAGAFSCEPGKVVFLTDQGAASISVEVADTDESRAKGLMFRKDLPQGSGMIFVYPQPQPLAFWMRNTLIPLDIVFLDSHGVVRHIHAGAKPLDETSIPGALPGDADPNRQFVVELPAGDAVRLGLKPGDRMASGLVPQLNAAAPCQ